jgi:superfamily II DNA or RNA helicase
MNQFNDHAEHSDFFPAIISKHPGDSSNVYSVLAAKKEDIELLPGDVAAAVLDDVTLFLKQAASAKKPTLKAEGENFLLLGIRFKPERARFFISSISIDDSSAAHVVVKSSAVPFAKKKVNYIYDGTAAFSNRLAITVTKNFSRTGMKNSASLEFTFSLSKEEARALSGNTEVEDFKLALSFGSLADSNLSEMAPYYSAKAISTRAKSQKTDITIRVSTGQILYLPNIDLRNSIDKAMKDSYDPESATFTPPSGEDAVVVPKDIVYWNLAEGIITYVSTDGKLRGLPIENYTLVNESNALAIITASLDSTLYRFGSGGSGTLNYAFEFAFADNTEIYPTAYREANDGYSIMYADTLEAACIGMQRAYGNEGLKHIKKTIKFLKAEQPTGVFGHPLKRYSVLAALEVMKDYYNAIDDLKADVQDKIAAIDSKTTRDIPALPANLDPGLQFYPHQAEAFAKANVALPTAIFDVATGGGKTILGIVDALNLLAKGTIKRPLFVMPPNLISQWFDEVQDFGDGKINVITISTETVNKWGLDVLAKLIKSAPKNTFFLTTYNWLMLDYKSQKMGTRVIYEFPNVEFLISLGLNSYVLLDESHFIKNTGSITHMACIKLGATADVKRLSTGTLMPNLPTDIIGQMMFLDPTIFGSTKDFIDEYAEQVTSSGRVISWKPEAYPLIRSKLKEAGALTYTRKDWFYLLPKLKESFHIVSLNKAQQKIYDAVYKATLEEIKADPKLGPMWEKMQSADDIDDATFAPLLARLKRIERFASAPETDELSELYLDDEDLISPKLAKVDELISKHLAKTPDEKILLLTQSVPVAQYFMAYSNHKDKMIFYRGGLKENLIKFQRDPKIKVLCGVDQSLKHGLNLQVASRMIRLDTHWAPGDLDQVLARIFRPTKGEDTREFIRMDWVLSDNTLDILKLRRVIRKMIVNSKMVGIIDPGDIPDRVMIPVNEYSLEYQNKWEDVEKDEVVDYGRYRALEGEKWEVLREEMPTEPIPAKFTKAISGGKIDTPWPKGVAIPLENTLSFDEALVQLSGGDFKNLAGYKAVTEFGPGYITSVRKTKRGHSVRIHMDDGRKLAVKDILVGVLPERIKKRKKKKEDEYKIDIPGTVIRIGPREYLLSKEGELHKVKRGKIVKLSYTLVGDKWITPKGGTAKLITPKIHTVLLSELGKLGHAIKEKVIKPPVEKPTIPSKISTVTGIQVRAINISGMTGLIVRYSKKDKKEIKPVVKGLRMVDMPYYRLGIANATAPRLVRALKADQLKPKNKKSLIMILEQFKRARYKMKNIDDSVIDSMKKLMRKYMRSSEFFMFPVLMGAQRLQESIYLK